jgi:hypothetical protein
MKATNGLLLKLKEIWKKAGETPSGGTPKEQRTAIIDELEARRGSVTVNAILDALSFKKLFLFWVILLVFFGLGYYRFHTENSYLFYPMTNSRVTALSDCIYFSFVTATTTGFGDIVPVGGFRSLAVAEVVLALILLSLLTSKIISVKQNVILGETYEISLNEKIFRLRSSFLLFRQHIERLIAGIGDGTTKRSDIEGLHMHMLLLEDTLRESVMLFERSKGKEFVKEIDQVNTELIAGSVITSLNKTEELIHAAEKKKIAWNTECNVTAVMKVTELSGRLFDTMRIRDEKEADENRKLLARVSGHLKGKMPKNRSKKLVC